MTEAIQNGETVDKEPAYISKGAQKGSNDIGNSYVEIDLTNQHLYLFKDGDIVLETDFVSGNMSKADCVTPPGVFGLTYKTRNAICVVRIMKHRLITGCRLTVMLACMMQHGGELSEEPFI